MEDQFEQELQAAKRVSKKSLAIICDILEHIDNTRDAMSPETVPDLVVSLLRAGDKYIKSEETIGFLTRKLEGKPASFEEYEESRMWIYDPLSQS